MLLVAGFAHARLPRRKLTESLATARGHITLAKHVSGILRPVP